MTRGTLTILLNRNNSIDMLSSMQFNGDMGPEQTCGQLYGGKLLRSVKDEEGFNALARKTECDYGYSDPKCKDSQTAWQCVEKFPGDGEIVISKEIFIKCLHYSDYTYLKNLSGLDIRLTDVDGETRTVESGSGTVLRFGSFLEQPKIDEFVQSIS